jgi:hypothetical protein
MVIADLEFVAAMARTLLWTLSSLRSAFWDPGVIFMSPYFRPKIFGTHFLEFVDKVASKNRG